MRPSLVLLALLASLLFACGDDANEREIRDTIEGFFLALNEDPPKAYTYLSEECKERANFFEFAAGLAFIQGFLGDSEPEVMDFEVVERGDDGVTVDYQVVVTSEGEEISLTEGLNEDGPPSSFVREDGRWRFGDCDIFGPGAEFEEGVATAEPVPEEDSGISAAQQAEADDDPALPGDFVDLPVLYGGPYPDTASHLEEQIDYRAQGLPPAGGPHWGAGACPPDPADAPLYCGPVPWGFYTEPWDASSLVHNMEHSGVVVWYNTDDPEIIDDLSEFAQDNSDRLLVVSPYPEMEEESVAITAWSRRDRFSTDEYDRDRLQTFLDAHECRFDPEGFCG